MYKSYKQDCRELGANYPDLSAKFERWGFLDQALKWATRADSEIGAIDFIQQDEFSHDAIFHFLPTNSYIVFGVT